MSKSIREAAGSLLVVGLSSPELTGLERAWLKLVRPAGIILFRRNIAHAAQTRALLHEASALCSAHSLRCVDVEGGTVDRLRDALAPIPSAQAVALAARHTGSVKLIPKVRLIQEHGRLIAEAVKAFGFNTTLAPVLDLALAASASVIGSRAVSSSPVEVGEFASQFLIGLKAQGVVGCGKHFPGLGGGTLDSHLETPSIRRGALLWSEDVAPFCELAGNLPMIMVNHASYPDQESGDLPASVSKFWITTVLRKRIGYRGIIFSDDLEMGGILKFMTIEEAVIAAVRAGIDLMEICHSPELILRAYESLLREAERSRVFQGLLLARATRTSIERKKLFSGAHSPALSARRLEALRTRIQRFSETIAKAQPPTEPQTV
jgi:beta-N-acetylhexosaminidase